MIKKILLIGLPVFIATTVMLQLVLAATNTPAPQPTMSTASVIAPPTPEEVEAELNQFRMENDLPVLYTDNPVLDEAAQARAESMCAANDWSHDKAWEVLDQYYQYDFASENLHYDFLQKDQAANAIYGWEHSPGHLKTMLADHTEAAIGVKYCPGFQGMPTAVLIVNYFGNPR